MTRDPAPPANAYSHRFCVPKSDIDDLGHAGNVSWVRWVNDAATEHSRSIGLDPELEFGGRVVQRHQQR